MLKRTSVAVWQGDGLTGKGVLDTQSGVFKQQPYSFQTRFGAEDGKAGTNPEELIAAAHAGCFSMALSFGLTGAGHPPTELRTSATVVMDKEGVHWFIKSIDLVLEAKVPGITEAKFQELAKGAKETCPISRALSATPITLQAKLLG
jgi:osmotically inducible protein OsmC